jgi:hypothetical protein
MNLQDFARTLRRYGLSWSTGRVSDFEGGRAAPNLGTLFVVAAALNAVHKDRDVTLADLFDGMGPVQVNSELHVQLRAIKAALQGAPATPTRLTAAVFNPQDPLPEWARGMDHKLIARMLLDFLETDQRMCKRLGVTAEVGAAAMVKLWGRTFTAERDRRAGPDAKPQHRGQVSRQLQAELKKVVSDGDN